MLGDIHHRAHHRTHHARVAHHGALRTPGGGLSVSVKVPWERADAGYDCWSGTAAPRACGDGPLDTLRGLDHRPLLPACVVLSRFRRSGVRAVVSQPSDGSAAVCDEAASEADRPPPTPRGTSSARRPSGASTGSSGGAAWLAHRQARDRLPGRTSPCCHPPVGPQGAHRRSFRVARRGRGRVL